MTDTETVNVTTLESVASNGYQRSILENLLAAIDSADRELASLKGEYMEECKGPRADMAAVFERAKDAGIAVRAFRMLVKNRRLDKQKERNVAALEEDQRSELEQMQAALGEFGDTPLGQAALRTVQGEETLDNLRADEAPRADEAQLSELGRG